MLRRVLTLVAVGGLAYVGVQQVRKRMGGPSDDDFWDDFDEDVPEATPPDGASPPRPLMATEPPSATAPPSAGGSDGSDGTTRPDAPTPTPERVHAETSAGAAAEATASTPGPAPTPAAATAEMDGAIKGNVRADGKRIYHMPGDPAYERVNPEQRFHSAADAEAAGFRRAGPR